MSDTELSIGDEVYSTVAKPPYGMVIEDDYRDGYVSVFWASGLIGGLKKEWMREMRGGK